MSPHFVSDIAKTPADHESWVGCGNHIPRVMDKIPHDQWCTCNPKVEEDGKEYPPMVSLTSKCTSSEST